MSGIFSFISFLRGYDNTKKLDMAGTWSTIRKQVKRTPDTTVETTFLFRSCSNFSVPETVFSTRLKKSCEFFKQAQNLFNFDAKLKQKPSLPFLN